MSGPRVHIRPTEPGDQDAFLAAMRASRKLHRPWLSPPTTVEQFEAMLNRARDPDSFRALLACRNADGAIAGYFNISHIIRGPLQSAFLGYGGVAALAGRGYMTEAMRLVLRHAFLDLRLHRLEANIQPGNAASTALAQRCGFEREGFSARYLKVGGRWRDHERWAIWLERWRAHRANAQS